MFPFPDNHFVQVGEDNHNGGGNQFFPQLVDHDDYRDLLHAICLLPPATINASSTVPSADPSLPPDPSRPSSTAKEASHKPPSLGSRKRAVRKDRHSKIVTANGTRDRRMRLSLDVARKFFDLQDALHFDKPSKTVEWLLNKSKYAIESLAACSRPRRPARGSTGADDKAAESAYSSGCEVDSTSMIGNDGSNDGIGNIQINSPSAAAPANLTGERAKSAERSNKQLPPRKAALHPAFVKESRAKARARARERTMEKKVLKQLVPPPSVPFSDSRETRSMESEAGAPAQQAGDGTRQPETMAMPTAVAQSRWGEISIFDYKNTASSFGYLKERCIFETPSGGSWGASN